MTEAGGAPLPDACATAFKEWEGVCSALLGGRQSLILRKGGIDEGPGPGMFRPEYSAFWLYPTRVHQQQQGLKPEAHGGTAVEPTPGAGAVALRGLAVVERVFRVNEPARLARLDALHVWTPETVEARFRYRSPGLWVLAVRVYRRPEPKLVPVTSDQAGCKSWVPLGEGLSTSGLAPVLEGPEYRRIMGRIAAVLEADDADSTTG